MARKRSKVNRARKARDAQVRRDVETRTSIENLDNFNSNLSRGVLTADDILLSEDEIARLPNAVREHRQRQWDWLATEASVMDIPQGEPGSWERCEFFRITLNTFTTMELIYRGMLVNDEEEGAPNNLPLDEQVMLSAFGTASIASG